VSEAPIYPGSKVPIPASQSLVELAGRAGTTLELAPGDRNTQYAWEPFVPDVQTGKQRALASDVDLQIQWVKATKPINNPPLVYWRLEYGHGEATYGLPMRSSLGVAPDLFNTQPGWILPNRGLRLRLPTRACRFHFFTPAESEPPPEPVEPGGAPCTLQISVQPCFGLGSQQLPVTDGMIAQIIAPVLDGTPSQLPLGATEMRLVDPTTGQAFPGLETVAFYDVTGAPMAAGPQSASLYALWTPIPLFAAFWAMDELAQVSYR
jgi:hypothetical protein